MKGANNTYWGNVLESVRSLTVGLGISIRHFAKAFRKNRAPIAPVNTHYFDHKEGVFTLQYPSETLPVPDTGRYRLHNEIEDCIVCDKCAKVCPVDCIDIVPIRSTEEIRKASDGSSVRLYAEKFEIDMAKCCFCGLCTTVCPTECLTMTKTYDFSVFDIRDMAYEFSDLSPEEAKEKKIAFEEAQALKKAQQTADAKDTPATENTKPTAKPSFKPKIVVNRKPTDEGETNNPIA